MIYLVPLLNSEKFDLTCEKFKKGKVNIGVVTIGDKPNKAYYSEIKSLSIAKIDHTHFYDDSFVSVIEDKIKNLSFRKDIDYIIVDYINSFKSEEEKERIKDSIKYGKDYFEIRNEQYIFNTYKFLKDIFANKPKRFTL